MNSFKETSPTKISQSEINTCVIKGTDVVPKEQKHENIEPPPVLWLCFATRLGLKHFSKEAPVDDKVHGNSIITSLPEDKNSINMNNNLLNMNTTQGVHLSNNMKKETDSQSREEFPLKKNSSHSVNQDSQHQNWINSNLDKTSSSMMTCMDLRDLQKKLHSTRQELKKINKELRESYANYDHLEVYMHVSYSYYHP